MGADATTLTRAEELLPERLAADTLTVAERWRRRGRWADALTLLRGIAPVVRELGEPAAARQTTAIGRVLTDMATFGGHDTLAERATILDQAMLHAAASADTALIGDACDAQGMSLHVMFLDGDRSQEPAEELPLFERALALRRQANTATDIAESLFHVGLVYGVVRADHAQALPYFEDAYRRATDAHDPIIASYAIRHIAFARADAGDLPAAIAALDESLRLRDSAGFIPGVAMAYMIMMHPYKLLGDTAAAIRVLERARAIFATLDAPRRVAEIDEQLAQLE